MFRKTMGGMLVALCVAGVASAQEKTVMVGGAPEQTDSLLVPAYIRMRAKRTKWMYAPDKNWGSDLYTVTKNRSLNDATFLENIAARALKPLIDDDRAESITVSTEVVARHGVGMKTKIIDARGEGEQITLIPIGN